MVAKAEQVDDGSTKQLAVDARAKEIVSNFDPMIPHITVNRIHTGIPLNSQDELKSFVESIFDVVVNDVVDDHESDCSKQARSAETLADICSSIVHTWQNHNSSAEFQEQITSAVATQDEHSHTLGGNTLPCRDMKRALLDVVQGKFEEMAAKLSMAIKDGDGFSQTSEHAFIALVSFIGHLYVRELVAARVLASVVHDLVGVRDNTPGETSIRCTCELMLIIGKAIDEKRNSSTVLMSQFLDRLSSLAAIRHRETLEFLYPVAIREAIKAVHTARSEKWPPRSGTQVLVQFSIVALAEAKETWHHLKKEKSLPVDQMELPDPAGIEETGEHLKIAAVISGRSIAVLFSQNVEELKLSGLRDAIFKLTGIRKHRLVIFKPDSTMWDD